MKHLSDSHAGARNLLIGCAGLSRGGRVLILHEDPALGYYDTAIVTALIETAAGLGLVAEQRQVPFTGTVQDPSDDLIAAMRAADVTVFLARMGDQIRYRTSLKGIRAVICYALDKPMLSSAFGTVAYRGSLALKAAIDDTIAKADEIRVTCALGTDFLGRLNGSAAQAHDMNVTRFPMSVFAPICASGFEGRVVQQGFLVGTGSQYYDPYACRLEAPLSVHIRGNRIAGFEGAVQDKKAAAMHYETVATRFGIDPWYVHSWHAGIHPGCAFPAPARTSFERWTGGAFGNPRLMHIHTCGAYAPGEISLNVIDPTIAVDGVAVWDKGRLHPERLKGGQAILDNHPDLAAVIANPAQACGLGPLGALSFD